MIAVFFEVDVKPERLADFIPRMELQARNSVALEPDCHQFDVWQDIEAPEKVTLYEVYENRAAFDAHLAFQAEPWEEQCGSWGCLDLFGLGAAVVGVEDKAIFTKEFHEHGA